MVNGQLLSGDKEESNATAEAEESNATAEATDYTDNEDLLSARQFQALQSWNFLSTIAATSKMVVGMES